MNIVHDGEGFNLNLLHRHGCHEVFVCRGLGLLGMKERVALIGGAIHVCSTPSLGTQIEIRIALTKTEVLHA